ncbi:hypothetical protein HMPREF1624_00427 [Sporothrix schenckii ATCC 58251]|uniref:Circumsporozoite protein n=1 Tax=Sporothrix schenckii (strain ATCC 58251 / de Perez 2211183) TaxID=1391915 RepID=U7Q529_SPOS1|nr:hypothetical protein HMPREF1624_00427 [Sporothrix schenckii ATCC 58251]
MMSRFVPALIFASAVQARFGQEEGNGAIAAIGALTDLGQPGQAATLAGSSIQFLLAAANPCGKLTQADLILSELGTSDAAVVAARGLVAAEQNFNPFVVSVPSICSDPTLPVSPELRGVIPLIDPAVGGSNLENANAAKSKSTPFDATGLSVAQVMVARGFSNFTAVSADGTKADASSLGTSVSGSAANVAGSSSASAVAAVASSAKNCGGVATTFITVTAGAATAAATDAAAATTVVASAGAKTSGTSPSTGFGAVSDPVKGTFDGFVASTVAGLDFGLCVPTMKFEAGLNGRSTSESTFQAIDPLVNAGQQEALNPQIIMNRIHDQLTNVCGANQAAKDAAASALAQVVATGKRDVTTAETWNTLLGFGGTNTNPDNAPQTGLVGHA